MILPESQSRLTSWSGDIIDRCRSSAHERAQTARALRTWRYTGSDNGVEAIVNRLDHHVDRTASMLYSPSDLRFHIDFEHTYGKPILDQAEVASRVLTRMFERRDIDMRFSQGVDIALQYGSCIPKLIYGEGGVDCRLTMPWQFSVYREDLEELGDQEAVVETSYITPFDFWRRISHLSDARELFRRALSYAKRRHGGEPNGDGYFHQVVLAGTAPMVQTEAPFSSAPGGMVSLSGDPGGALLSPDVAQELLMFHELWVLDDERQDYTTIQMVEPDVLIAPRFRRRNMFVPRYLPYGIIRPNAVAGNFWGRSELLGLLKLQALLRDRMEDIKKLMSLQYDRIFAFIGQSGMNDEMYDQMRNAGWMTMESGDVKDITPPLPKEAFADIKEIVEFMDEVSGFANIMSGQGEPGVRAGNHAQTLLRTASPRMRDRALIVERQVADLGDKTLQCVAAKEAKAYWTDPDKPETEFLLTQLPDDYRVTVDSHSSSPIYEEDHKEVAAFLAKLGAVGGEDLIDLLPIPRRDQLKQHLREREKAKAEMIAQHPELLTKGHGGKSHH